MIICNNEFEARLNAAHSIMYENIVKSVEIVKLENGKYGVIREVMSDEEYDNFQ